MRKQTKNFNATPLKKYFKKHVNSQLLKVIIYNNIYNNDTMKFGSYSHCRVINVFHTIICYQRNSDTTIRFSNKLE